MNILPLLLLAAAAGAAPDKKNDPVASAPAGSSQVSDAQANQFELLKQRLLQKNNIPVAAAKDPNAAVVVTPTMQALSVPPAGGRTGGTTPPVTPPGTFPPGGKPPPSTTPPTWEEQEKARAAAFDKEYGDGEYEKIVNFESHCYSSNGCNKLQTADIINGGYKFVDLEDDVARGDLQRGSPDYKDRHRGIMDGMRDTVIALHPADHKLPPSQAELASISEPVVSKIFPELPKPDPQTRPGRKPGDQQEPGSKPEGAGGPGGPGGGGAPGETLPSQSERAYERAVTDSRSLGSSASSSDAATPADWLMGKSLSTPVMGASAAPQAGAPVVAESILPADAAMPSLSEAQGPARRSAELTNAARRSLSVGDARAAAAALRQAVAANPSSAEALALLSMAQSRSKDFRAALAAAQAGLKLAPANSALLDSQAYALNGLKDYPAATKAADAAIKANPRDAMAYFNRAIARAGLGDRDGTLDALRRAAALSPKFEQYAAAAEQLPAENFTFPAAPGARPFSAPSSEPAEGPASSGRLGMAVGGGGALLVILIGLLRSRRPAVLAPIAPPAQPRSSVLAAKYELGRQLGQGGMGIVFEGRDRTLDRRVAIKRMREEIRWDRRERERFMSEARVVAQLRHPNIVNIHEIAEDAGEIYLVFEYVEGRTLKDIFDNEGPMPLPKALELFAGVASALDYAQEKSIIHRDLKPGNVMIDAEGRVRVMDFGLARVAEEALSRHRPTSATTAVGTPAYMAPEQEQGAARRESDVFSLGVCLYEALTGRKPFGGTGAGLLLNKINKVFAPPSTLAPGLPEGIDAALARALDPEPVKRYPTAGAFLRELEAVRS